MISRSKYIEYFKTISSISEIKGTPTFIIGGFVRDLILERESKDVDIVVVGSGIEMAEKFAESIPSKPKVNVFKTFGTAMVHLEDIEIEFVGARKESYNKESRKPTVENGTVEDDQNRRDFTINALAIGLNKYNFGELIDPFNGISDLENKIIKTPLDPNITFSDDPLRMMRAIRFASQLNFKIETKTFEAIKENKERISIISRERIIDELNKIMLSQKPSIGLKLLDDCELLEYILPELTALKGVESIDNKAHKDNFLHSIQVLDNLCEKSNNLWIRWAALLHDIGKARTKTFGENGWTFHGHDYIGGKMIPKLFNRIKLPLNEKMLYVKKLVELHLRPIALVDEEVSDSAIRRLLFDAGDDIDDLLMLCEADITSKNQYKVKTILANYQNIRRKIEEIEEKDKIKNFQPPITGEIIMEYFKIKPCKEIGLIKNTIKDYILDGKIENNYEQSFELMKKLGEEIGLK